MNPLVLLALVAGLPVLLAFLLRVNSIYVFASIGAGFMLQKFMSETTSLTLRSFYKHDQIELIAALVLLLLPVLLTLLLLRKTMPVTQLPLQIIPVLGNGLTLAVLVTGVVPNSTIDAIKTNPISHATYRASDIIVTLTVVVHLLLMMATAKHHDKKRKHH